MRFMTLSIVFALVAGVSLGWVGVDVKPLKKERSELAPDQSGTYYQLGDNERKELVWMAKAANAAYVGRPKPLGYRSFSREEWDKCAEGCAEVVYTEDGYFNVGSGLRGRLMVNMLNEGRVILALSGCDFELSEEEFLKDFRQCVKQYFTCTAEQYRQALEVMKGVLGLRPRTELWIVGHSLGGSLTTYLALNLPKSKTNVKCATFNGYGLSPSFSAPSEDTKLAARRIRNVYCDNDIVFRIVGTRHFGPTYSLISSRDWMEAHDLDAMLKLMIANRTGWQGL